MRRLVCGRTDFCTFDFSDLWGLVPFWISLAVTSSYHLTPDRTNERTIDINTTVQGIHAEENDVCACDLLFPICNFFRSWWRNERERERERERKWERKRKNWDSAWISSDLNIPANIRNDERVRKRRVRLNRVEEKCNFLRNSRILNNRPPFGRVQTVFQLSNRVFHRKAFFSIYRSSGLSLWLIIMIHGRN